MKLRSLMMLEGSEVNLTLSKGRQDSPKSPGFASFTTHPPPPPYVRSHQELLAQITGASDLPKLLLHQSPRLLHSSGRSVNRHCSPKDTLLMFKYSLVNDEGNVIMFLQSTLGKSGGKPLHRRQTGPLQNLLDYSYLICPCTKQRGAYASGSLTYRPPRRTRYCSNRGYGGHLWTGFVNIEESLNSLTRTGRPLHLKSLESVSSYRDHLSILNDEATNSYSQVECNLSGTTSASHLQLGR
ncbi:hypothetical protein Tco_1391627 [Tanacetum coccineum]|uniref:Uncharacterized protein n=1 Tax=Tanacetum coccineum TaxID=301880 RepID=A0ABQ4WT38_9ASTR